MRPHATGWWFGLLLSAVLTAGAMEFRLQADRLSLQAKGARLTDVLREFGRVGVRVLADPRVEARITADFQDEEAQKALARLLEPFGYVLIWDVLEGPIGAMPRLAEIQVFLPGKKQKLKPLPGLEENLAVAEGPAPGGPRFVQDEIVIGFRAGVRREEVERLLAQIGAMVIGSVPDLGLYRLRLPPGSNIPALVEQLAHHPIVKGVEPNYVIEVSPPESARVSETGRVSILPLATNAASVAILDSGLQAGLDISATVIGRYDAINPDRALTDRLGHGTQMALVVSGSVTPAGAPSTPAAESAPLIAIRAFDDNGYASSFGLMRSLDYAADQGARVVNLSWGTETRSDFLAAAIAHAQARGMIVVAAAGNEPTGRPTYPAAYPGVVAVGALDANNQRWSSSNYGAFVTVSAPGAARFEIGYRGPPGAYAGTSISSAYVSRALALYLARHPQASAQQAADALRRAVSAGGQEQADSGIGYGRLDAAALARLLE